MEKFNVVMAWGSVVLALGAGFLMAMQPSVNARLASRCEHPLQASIISFGTGFAALVVMALLFRVGLPQPTKLQTLPAWAWTGGLIGTYMVTVSMLVAPRMGATRWIALVLAGQIALSLVLDHFGWAGYAQHQLSWLRVIGIACVVIGVVLVMLN
jgi:bacterial/archaeal transporter family-2 protein